MEDYEPYEYSDPVTLSNDVTVPQDCDLFYLDCDIGEFGAALYLDKGMFYNSHADQKLEVKRDEHEIFGPKKLFADTLPVPQPWYLRVINFKTSLRLLGYKISSGLVSERTFVRLYHIKLQ